MNLDDAFAPIDAAANPPPAASSKEDWHQITPVPADAPGPDFAKFALRGFAVSGNWAYHDGLGNLVGYAVRFDRPANGLPAEKQVKPLSYCEGPDGRRAWRLNGFEEPRPLYNMVALITNREAPVLVVEGEKTADAASKLFSDHIVITSPGGSNAAGKADWSRLKGRTVTVWPDADEAGAKYAAKVAELARKAGAASVAIVQLPTDVADGWDLADEPPAGMDIAALLASAKPTEPSTAWGFRLTANGVEKRFATPDKETGIPKIEWRRVCSKLEVIAETRSGSNEDWGRLLEITDRDGKVKTWAMPMAMLAGDGSGYRERLLSLGVELAAGRYVRDALHEYISTARPETKARCVGRTGWHSRLFVKHGQNFEG